MKPHRKIIGLAFSIILSIFFIAIFPSLESLDLKFFNIFYSLRGKEKPFKNIVLVEIDKKTINSLSIRRIDIGFLLKYLKDASCVGLIIPLSSTSQFEDDIILSTFLKGCGNVYLGVDFFISYLYEKQFPIFKPPEADNLVNFSLRDIPKEITPYQAIGVNAPISLFLKVISGIGHTNLLPDINGIISKIPLVIDYGGNFYPSLSLVLASSYLKRNPDYLLRSRVDFKSRISINFSGGQFPSYSMIDVLNKKINKNEFYKRIVLIGITSDENTFPTPYGLTNSLFLHAEAVNNILQANSVILVPFKLVALFLLLFGFISGWISLSNSTKIATLTIVSLCLSFLVFSFSLFCWGIWLNTLSILLLIFLVFIVSSGYRIFVEKKEKEMVKSIFGRYISPPIIDEALKDEEFLKRVIKKELTVVFADIANFSLLLETLEPRIVVCFLNDYFTEMSEIIFSLNGEIDKFMGDEILFLFGGIQKIPDHAEKGVLASIMMQKRLITLNEKWKDKGIPDVSLRIGINSGEVIMGNIGSSMRTDYTVLGKEVNLAKRLEEFCCPGEIIISETTYSLLPSGINAQPFKIKIKEAEGSLLSYKVLWR